MYFFETEIRTEESLKSVLVVFSGQHQGSEFDYSEMVESGYKNFSIRPEEVLFIFPKYLDETLQPLFTPESRLHDNLIRYGEKIPVTALAFDLYGNFTASAIHGTSAIDLASKDVEQNIADAGLRNLATQRKDSVILRAPSGTIFIKPSQQEFDEFIKAGELAVGYSENQFVAFSLLRHAPRGREITSIFIDTSGISTFVESLLYYWMKFSGSHCKNTKYISFNSYDGKDEAKPDTTSDVWLIISASRSNSMGIRMAKEWELQDEQVITLLSYTPASENTVGDNILLNIQQLSSSATKVQQEASLMKVKVLGENFTAEVEKPNPVLIKAIHKTPAVGSLIYPFREANLFHCNRRLSPRLPVAPVYLKCAATFKDDNSFREWITSIVDWYIPPTVGWLVYRKIDNDSEILKDLVLERLDENGVRKFDVVDLENASKDISGEKTVVVVMPVTGSGQTLLKLNRNLRLSGHTGNRIFISPFVLAPTKEAYTQFRNSLIYAPNNFKYQFFAWKEAFIGTQDSSNSWRRESQVVAQLDSDFWRQRLSILENLSEGLRGMLGTPSLDPSEKLSFTPNFAFWSDGDYDSNSANPEAVYTTIASILQGLRERKISETASDSLYSYVYQHSVIAPDCFTRYTDPLLQSCLWRAANDRELDYRSSALLSNEMSSIIERLIDENCKGEKNAAIDLLMGIAVGRISLERGVLTSLLQTASRSYRSTNKDASLLLEYIRSLHFPDDTHEPPEQVAF